MKIVELVFVIDVGKKKARGIPGLIRGAIHLA
jgi:hypothetical protein